MCFVAGSSSRPVVSPVQRIRRRYSPSIVPGGRWLFASSVLRLCRLAAAIGAVFSLLSRRCRYNPLMATTALPETYLSSERNMGEGDSKS